MSVKKNIEAFFSAMRGFFDCLCISVLQPDMDELNAEDSKETSNIEKKLKNLSTLDKPWSVFEIRDIVQMDNIELIPAYTEADYTCMYKNHNIP